MLICENGFKIVNNIPVVIPFLKSDCIFDDKTFNKSQNLGYKKRYSNKLILFIKKIKKIIEGNSLKSNLNFKFLTNYLSKSSKILIIGGGSKGSGMNHFYKYCETNKIQIASLDVYISKDVTVVADAIITFPRQFF